MGISRCRSALIVCVAFAVTSSCTRTSTPDPEAQTQAALQAAFTEAVERGTLDVHGDDHGTGDAHSHGPPPAGFDASSVRADLRDAAVAQMFFYSRHGRYASTLMELNFKPRADVRFELGQSTATGTSMVAQSSNREEECALVLGSIDTLPDYVQRPRQIFCRERTRSSG